MDEHPLPPARLRTLVGGAPDPQHFLDSGTRAARLILPFIATVEAHPAVVLDFGCGSGRTIRHLEGSAVLHGCDPNPSLVRWCNENLPFGQFTLSRREPPLPYEDSTFHLVYGISVFTHLTETLQRAWFAELARVIVPGGTLVITTHGDALAAAALSKRQREAYDLGRVVATYPRAAGKNLCAAYHPSGSVARLAPMLTVVDEHPRALEDHDIVVLMKLA